MTGKLISKLRIAVCVNVFVFCTWLQPMLAQTVDTAHLLLYLPFNGNANDASNYHNDGTVHGATLAADRFGNANSAYSFNGIDNYIEIPASSSLARIYTSNQITISAWINIHNWYQNWNVFAVFEQYDPVTDWGAILLEANWASGGILFESGYNTNYIGCDYTWTFNEWHHLAVTYSKSASEAKFYVDGVLKCTKPYSQNFSADVTRPFAIGRSLSGPDEYSDGIIDELQIYDTALDASDVANLPLQLRYFRGKADNGNALLEWETYNETNVKQFEIEAGSNGNSLVTIGSVNAKNGAAGNQYSFTRNNAPEGSQFYRLKMIDKDGRFTYSPIVQMAVRSNKGFYAFPNPSPNKITVRNPGQSGTLRLMNAEGRVLGQWLTTASGRELDLSKFPKGLYWLQLIDDSGMRIEKVVRD